MNNDEGNIRIMVVEDDPLIRQLFVQILTKKGFQVIGVASDGLEAINVYQELNEKPNLIIIDYNMPYKNGLEVTKELQQKNSDLDILMITGDSKLDQKLVLSHGIKLRKKPIHLEDLLNEIRMIGQ